MEVLIDERDGLENSSYHWLIFFLFICLFRIKKSPFAYKRYLVLGGTLALGSYADRLYEFGKFGVGGGSLTLTPQHTYIIPRYSNTLLLCVSKENGK